MTGGGVTQGAIIFVIILGKSKCLDKNNYVWKSDRIINENEISAS